MYKVILVDDERLILTSMERRLPWKKNGFEVVGRYTSALAAQRALDEVRPDVVFTDIRMPGMSGLEFLREISQRHPQMRTVVASGYADFEYAKTAMRFGAFGFCVKPFEYEEFDELLGRLRRELDKTRADADMTALLNAQDAPAEAQMTQRLEQAGFSAGRRILAALCDNELLPPEGMPHLAFRWQGYRAMLLPFDSWKQVQLHGTVGFSAPFMGQQGILPALEQAHQALLQPFVSGEPINFWHSGQMLPDTAQLLQQLQTAFRERDMEGVHRVFSELREIFCNREAPVAVAYQVYNTLAAVAAVEQLPHSWQQSCTAMVQQYGSVQKMLRELEELFVASLAGGLSRPGSAGPMEELLFYVDTHYYDPELTVQTLAERFCFSQNYVSQMFRKMRGERFTAYLTELRMEHAKDLLAHSELSIQEVGRRTGYNDYFYFARVFKTQVGMSAGAYREQCQRSAASESKESLSCQTHKPTTI